MPKPSWQERIESSRWGLVVLIVGALAAMANFGLNAVEQYLRIHQQVTAPEPPRAALRIERQGPEQSVAAPPELLKVLAIRNSVELQLAFSKALVKPLGSPREIITRQVRLLLLNPTKEKLTVHTCKAAAQRMITPFPRQSIGYFVETEIAKLRAEDVDPLLSVEPEGARRIDALFIFPSIPSFEDLGMKLKELQAGTAAALPQFEVQCEDQANRILRAVVLDHTRPYAPSQKKK